MLFENGDGEARAPDWPGGTSGDRLNVPVAVGGEKLGATDGTDEPGAAGAEAAALASEVAGQLATALRHAGLDAEPQATLDGAMDVVEVVDDDCGSASVNEAANRFYGRPRRS